MGGIIFCDGQVKLARCFSDAGVVSGVVRDRYPPGPRYEPVISIIIPTTNRGPMQSCLLCKGCQNKAGIFTIVSSDRKCGIDLGIRTNEVVG